MNRIWFLKYEVVLGRIGGSIIVEVGLIPIIGLVSLRMYGWKRTKTIWEP